MESMEESFPRGGLQKKAEGTAVKKRPREDDNLFSTRLEEVEEVKKKKQKDLSEKPKTLKPKKRVVSKDKDKGIDVLNYKSLHVGMLFLGCVKEAKDFELTVNLPYGLTGFVQATNICEAYTKLLNEQVEKDVPLEALSPLPNIYSPGMLVRCAVSSLETTSGGSQSIKLSLNPKLVNADLTPSSLQIGMFLSGCVSSIEDHGYLIDLGIGGNKAFLPRQKAQVYLNQTSKAASLCVGQYLNCVIDEKKNDGRIVRLSITQSDVAAAVATVEQKWTLNNLLPGLVVKAQIDKILPDGVILSFLSSYTGVVDFLHLESKKVASYQKNQTVKACILWIDRSSKTIRLTLHKSFLQPGSAVKQLTSDWIGTLHRRCTVNALYKNSGAVFQLDGETFGFAFNKNLSISKLKTPDKFQEGTVHTGRVVGFSPIDEILLLSFKGDVIGGLYLRLEDVQVGQILEGTVNSLTPLGMVVDITQHLNGLVPTLHLADVTLHQPEKKYALGSKIKCRVLSVVPSARKLILTRKKIMINSKLPILRTYHDATPGLITHGFIWSVKHCGCVIKFYNDVQGLALVHELSSVFISSPEEVFYKGQVVKVRVLECNPEKERMLLSFNIIGEEENEGKESEPSKKDTKNFERGKIVDVKIVRKSDDGLDVLILPEERPAFLPKTHLSDHIANCELLWHCLKAGDQVTGAMCLSTIQGKTILTKKPALISFMEKEPVVKDFSEIQIGMMFTGFVTNIMLFGVFVELPYGLVGLVPKSNISDKFVTNIHDHIAVGQTVVAKVTNLDEQKKRLLLTLKMSECAPDNRSAESFPRLRQCISEVQLARSLINRDGRLGDGENLYSLVPGKKLTVVVETVQEDDSVLFSVGQIAGAHKISATQHKDKAKSLVAGQKSKVVVLHVDFLKSHVHVSVDEILLRRLKDTILEDVPEGFLPTSKLRPKQTITCRVIGGRDVKTHRYLPITHPHLMESFLELSILPRLMDTKKRIPKLRPAKKYLPGVKVTCYVTKYNNEKQYLEVDVTPEMRGRVDQLLLSKSIKVVKRPEKHFKQGQALSATVVGTGLSPKTLSLSLIDTHTLTEGCVIIGCVKTVTPTSGLEISLPFGKTGKASLFHLGDCYAESSVKDFATGMFVRCYVLSVGKTIEVSLRNSRICPESVNDVTDKEISSVGSLKEGQLVAGFVESITDKGIFFRLSSSIVGRIQFKKDPQTYASYISEGTLLTVKILTIQEKKQRLELSLLPEDTEKPDIIPKSANLIPRTKNTFKRRRSDSESEAKIPKKKKKHQETKDDEDSGIEVYCRENETEHKKSNQKSDSGTKPPAPRLQVSSGFSWDVSLNNLKTSIAGGNESSSDSDEDEEEEQSKITKKDLQKTQIRKETPDPKQQPQSVHEFERLVITSPNISANWIQYIDFNLQATELEQARAVAERALQTIYFREEQEKLTVWAAMLNMENTFGTEATLQKVFERAIQYNDPLKAFQHLVDIYIKSEKFKEAENLLNTMVKRFRQEKSVWWKYATFLLKRGQSEDTHRLLQRALKCVPEKEHVDLISKFAQLEFRFGDVVRAKALFESTLSSYPKRTDLWSVYIDMMVKHGSQKEVRDIFERVIHLSLAPKRIKFFFKRYLEYERKDGSEKTVQAVKEKALKYVESKGSAK
ncbi:protein RRP5 homolog isoform X2 [Rhinoderma darwinii]|uniref:protein RRP5 homolog isoform X2 n=1 Tax=Rhinoderma darwinii TaxID=43563 RepID=UPI003F66B30F